MGHYEDFWWDITEDINNKGLRKQFNAQLKKMNNQDKHQYRDVRSKWDYAHKKVTQENEENKKK
jgi:hypothetical protein